MAGLNKAIAGLTAKQRAILEMRLNSKRKEPPKGRISRRPPDLKYLPLSFAQQRLWFLDRLEPGSSFYNVPVGLHLNGPLNVIALEAAISEISRRHEVLRTTFQTIDGQPVQVISTAAPLVAPLTDLTRLTEADAKKEVDRLANEEAHRTFDLEMGPMLCFHLLRSGDQNHLLLMLNHHIVADEWSSVVFVREISMLYKEFLMGRPSPLQELPVQYPDYAIWQREWLRDEILEAHLSYWRKALAGAPRSINLATDRPRPPVQTFNGASKSLWLAEALNRDLRNLSSRQGVTLFIALLAAFDALLHYYSGQDDLLVGSPIANRNQIETESLIGFFVNTLVLRTDLSGDPSFKQLLTRVRETVLGAHTYQDLPFEKLVDEIRPDRNLSYNPLFQVCFALNNISVPELELPYLSLRIQQVDRWAAHFDLVLHMVDSGREIYGSLQYNTDLFDAATMSRMLEHYEMLLHRVVSCPDVKLSDLKTVLAEADRQYRLATEKQVEQANLLKLKLIRQRAMNKSQRQKGSGH